MKIFKRFIAVLLVFSVFPWGTTVSVATKGDMNNDGKILINEKI